MRARPLIIFPLLLTGAVLLGACQQDPYKIRSYGDAAAGSDGLWPDMQIAPDGSTSKDATGDGDATSAADLSYDACLALPEACNGVDDNCNTQIDEGFDKQTDPRYCEDCKGCMWLLQKNAYPGCTAGKCSISTCMNGYEDLDKDVSNGCEYGCTKTGVEVCDGVDNDCNGTKCTQDSDCIAPGTCGSDGHCVDEGVTLSQNICLTQGPCGGAQAACKGSLGWVCQYSADVELQSCTSDADCGGGLKCVGGVCPGVVAVDEAKCDDKDGDCDGLADDPWANPGLPNALGKSCDMDDPPKQGICRRVGSYACAASGSGVACVAKSCGSTADCDTTLNPEITCTGGVCTAATASNELCNGVDDNCDGIVDNNVTDEVWTTVGTGSSAFQIFKYEASRPDASGNDEGIDSAGRPCSVPGRLPWGNLPHKEALAACKRAGARLCTATEWEQACKGSSNQSCDLPNSYCYPYGSTFDPGKCNGREWDTSATSSCTKDSDCGANRTCDPKTGKCSNDYPLPSDEPKNGSQPTCVSSWPQGQVLNMSGNLKEWVALGSGSSPTGYQIKGGAYDTPSLNGAGAGLSCLYDLPDPTGPSCGGASQPPCLKLPSLGFRCCK